MFFKITFRKNDSKTCNLNTWKKTISVTLIFFFFIKAPGKMKRREVKGKREKERYTHLNAEFQRTGRRDKKAFLSEQCKETGKQEWERLAISSRKLKTSREHFMQGWA